MRMKLCKLAIVTSFVAVLLTVAGCVGSTVEGEVSGGGGIAREDGSRAVFTYHGSSCGSTQDPPIPVSGKFNFLDKGPAAAAAYGKNGVMVDGTITAMGQCAIMGGCSDASIPQGVCPQGGYMFTFDYRNKNSKVAGDGGTGGACVVDNGEGRSAPGPDTAAIGFADGPYAGYSTSGIINGNAQGHLCD